MAESYVQRWARENAERSVAEQKENTEQKPDMTEEKGVGLGARERERSAEKKTKSRRKSSSVVE